MGSQNQGGFNHQHLCTACSQKPAQPFEPGGTAFVRQTHGQGLNLLNKSSVLDCFPIKIYQKDYNHFNLPSEGC